MKKLILLFITVFTLSCCSKSENSSTPVAPIDQLPPATQTGANKVGCLVNGQVFLPYQSNPFGVPSVTCSYQFVNNNYEFGFGIRNDKMSEARGITILTNKLEFIQGQTYLLKQEEITNSSFAYYKIGFSNGFGTNTINTGELKITRLDETNAIISGTFWFDAVNSIGTKVEVREGRFDMQYSQ